jgi:uncharacterized protein YgiM (DUF1202 family)
MEPGITDRTRWRARSRLLGLLILAPGFAGCASMTQDVDAYYRQMAFNFQEAADKAKLNEVALENESRVLGVTGDQSRYRKAQKQLRRIKDWEEHCAKEKVRFEKAAEWMETHLKVKKAEIKGENEPASEPKTAGSSDLEKSSAHDLKESYGS